MSLADIERTCAAAREALQLPGLAVAACGPEGAVFAGAWGEADLENGVALSPDGVFEIASVTKLFTAEAVMLLVQDGALALDARLGDLLPELPEAWHEVAVRDILSHQSGLPSYTEAEGYWQGAALDRGPAGILQLVREIPLRFVPGERFAYDNTGFYLLGMVIEALSRRTYADLLRERIFDPLGLSSMRANDYRALVPGRVRGYSRSEDGVHNKASYSTSNTFSAGVLLASAGDLARFAAAVQSGGLLAPELRRLMRTPRPSRAGNELAAGFQVGLGWFLVDDGERRFEGHGGGILGFRSALVRRPEEGVSVVVLANGDWWERPEDLALEVAALLA